MINPIIVTFDNIDEVVVAKKAVDVYNKQKADNDYLEDFLRSKKFHLGDIVVKDGTTHFDNVFGTGDGSIGKIVGWDFEYEYYRVYFNETQSYQGVREERLTKYLGTEPIPSDVLNEPLKDITEIRVQL